MTFQLLAAGSTVANTYGWDTVSAVRVGDMNRTIREAGSSPKSFEQELDHGAGHVRGGFGDWQIDSGGDGRLIHVAIPLEGVDASYGGQTWQGDALARVEVQLHFVPHGPPQANSQSLRHALVVRTAQDARRLTALPGVAAPANVPIANVLEVEYEQEADDPGMLVTTMIKLGLTEWLCANLDQFTHVFATVNIHQVATEDAFFWLKPTYATYVFLACPNPDDSVFGILCRTGERSPDDLIEQISPYAIPPGVEAGFLLSPGRMLGDMMARSLPEVLDGLKLRDIKVDEQHNRLKVDKKVKLQKVKDKDGREVEPVLEQLEVELRERELIMKSTISSKVSPGITSVGESQCFYNIGLVTKRDGTRTLGYRESRKPIKRDYTRKDKGVTILEWMLMIGGIIVGVAMIWNGVGVGLIIAALAIGGVGLTLKVIEAVHRDDAPAIDVFVEQATESITWSNGSTFDLISAELNGALQMGGNFKGKVRRL
jgi:hypothetical protein